MICGCVTVIRQAIVTRALEGGRAFVFLSNWTAVFVAMVLFV